MKPVILYGSYGYTGQLIVQKCKRIGIDLLLSGRGEGKLKEQSIATGFPFEPVNLYDTTALCRLLEKGSLVIHAAGPFKYTALPIAEACLKTKTHYTDITGEIEVFESLAKLDSKAKASGITVMPGVGFDVVPSDCLAAHLKSRLPSATHLELAFASKSAALSRGTSKTMIESLGLGGAVRKDGKIISVPMHEGSKVINYGEMKLPSLRIPWGDVSTAFYSTGIPNIEVYRGADEKLISQVKMSRFLNWLLRMKWVKKYLKNQIDKKPAGPSQEKRERTKMYFTGKASDGQQEKISRLETMEGYSLTANKCVDCSENHLRKFQSRFSNAIHCVWS